MLTACVLLHRKSKLKAQVLSGASLVAQMVKNPLAMHETRVGSLGQEDPLEKEMVTHSGNLAWKIPWTQKPGRLHRVTERCTQVSNFTFPFFSGSSALAVSSWG